VVDPLPGTSFSEIEQAFFDKLIPGRQQAFVSSRTDPGSNRIPEH
jgi:hypothetical protein